jgi:hypothetical protein
MSDGNNKTFKNYPDAMRSVLNSLGIASGESEEDLYSVVKWGAAARRLDELQRPIESNRADNKDSEL